MRNNLKFAASAAALFALLSGVIGDLGGLPGLDPDDMHWPTSSASGTATVTVDAAPAGALG